MAERKPIKLSEHDKKTLEDLQDDMDWLENEITKAERAGMDVTKLREEFEKTKRLRDGLLREYS